ncbi:nucleotidyl transferase AbiEii/AbiGii toxin family protein [Desulfobacula toluolica]|uniref:Conserved uncharacterized protein n=1 Tax=Desulfobacula toluolica (strain DSM 7467 / Tol2) TaxID=651182 RepID=K0NDJ4_DESTT|nr:nucleotidyl transferase AbiEii/AbiGii toxin family protein [Desulfobacula toluolica]CCK78966.1 conserved uncharacterized protein [Desulfobacula toluolica Tol2]
MFHEKKILTKLVEQAMKMDGQTHMRPVIEKELLHYDILFVLDKEKLLDKLTFQGGTSLRLCYGAVRFSEDLDFVGGRSFATGHLTEMKSCIEHYIGLKYGLDVMVKEPKEMAQEPQCRDIQVDKWQIIVITEPDRRHLPRQKIKIEVANIPAYSKVPRSLQQNYEFLPDGYADTLVMVESLEEIMADKLISLVNCQTYIRHRDIWDLRWLRQQGVKINVEFIKAKLLDYKVVDYFKKLEEMRLGLPEIVHGKAFRDQMSRFIPLDVQERTLFKEKFYIFLINETALLFQELAQLLNKKDKKECGDDFLI